MARVPPAPSSSPSARADSAGYVRAPVGRQAADPADQRSRRVGQRHSDRGGIGIGDNRHPLGFPIHVFRTGFRRQLGVLKGGTAHAAALIHHQCDRNPLGLFILDQLKILNLVLGIEQLEILFAKALGPRQIRCPFLR